MVPKGMNEAVPTHQLQYIPVGEITSIAFLFLLDDIQEVTSSGSEDEVPEELEPGASSKRRRSWAIWRAR